MAGTKPPVGDMIMEVVMLKDACPVYEIGDKLYCRWNEGGGYVIDTALSTTTKVCIGAMGAMPLVMVKVRSGMEDPVHFQCFDPGPPHTKTACVFKAYRVNRDS